MHEPAATPSELSRAERDAILRSWLPEPELRGPGPRPIPPEIRDGPHASQVRALARFLIVAGLSMVLAARLPIVREWGKVVLPLLVLDGFGAGTARRQF